MLQLIILIGGVLLGIVLFCLGVIYLEKRIPVKQYDERQLHARAKAHRISFWVGFVYYLVVTVILIEQVDGEKRVEPFLLVFAGMILQALVLHTYSILSDAAVPLSEKPWVAIVCYAFVGCIQLLQFILENRNGIHGFVGREAADWIFLMCGMSFAYLSLLHLIQRFRSQKE